MKLKNITGKSIKDDTFKSVPFPFVILPGETVELDRIKGLQLKAAFKKGKLIDVTNDNPKAEEKVEVKDDALPKKKKIKSKAKKEIVIDTDERPRLEE